ncbi:NAD/NADP transhydrogenase beta subunit [Desulfitobacterium dichloroeliminans LMG P-21439]|uniref:proton-translocating NAD(P)(+) transhydrogenase n=1 Tax=Desulfitobacterium dichloroeliminans (strain LMG P-21439 / DCA1) TaxID=871963 RepID=L0F3R3_DESDL|nr:NAD(P)(+) transhydrogenase (Re/Si-specific) subunit beta [Desulfitobacterium dichloroeliminans]AGA67817.1 NAD/NADP transhydrogenase beta subunit [Desulfitobacterium dichloroeliminans LMG P-21439]
MLGISAPVYFGMSFLLVVGFLSGIKKMNSPRTAVTGNAIGAITMMLAIILALLYYEISDLTSVLVAFFVGGLIGLVIAVKVKMIHMPQSVAFLNGVGATASALIALATILNGDATTFFVQVTSVLALIIGSMAMSGSLIAVGKLSGVLSPKPVVLKGHSAIFFATVSILILLWALSPFVPLTMTFVLLALGLAIFFGFLFAVRIGGADMPIMISLLNALTGVAGGAAGLAIYEPLLVAVGGIVGASGLILTQIMCRAMNRHLWAILTGKTTMSSSAPVAKKATSAPPSTSEAPATDLQSVLIKASTVIIVPGYGMALAQAQHEVKTLADTLEAQGKEVCFAVHPVAGRMPGHMNVLLAEAGVDYDKLLEMDEVNPRFPNTDVVVVIGSNDVINPAARNAVGTPIYGMPILDVEAAKHVIICNFDEKPGYAGVDNPLYDGRKGVTLMLGDAKKTVAALVDEVNREMTAGMAEGPSATDLQSVLTKASTVIIVPGYGMALAQAQHEVKTLADTLEAQGKEVCFAVHPVAGRMPGHMNVLLAEAGVDYDRLLEMDEVNPRFPNTDVVVVIGSNDVINPAARNAVGTPIYGMPILDVEAAKHVIICNFDEKPGYAGVDNPLYDGRKGVTLMLGDAKKTVAALVDEVNKELKGGLLSTG